MTKLIGWQRRQQVFCNRCGAKTRIKNSRSTEKLTVRRHECEACGHIFYTKEEECDWLEGMRIAEKIRVDRYERNKNQCLRTI